MSNDNNKTVSNDNNTNIFEGMGDYGSSWGITDLYEEHEKKLRETLSTGQDFIASWGAKKEIYYASVIRKGSQIGVSFRSSIDEIEDLTDTLIWEVVGGNAVCDSGFDWVCKRYGLNPEDEGDSVKASEIMEEAQEWIMDLYQGDYAASDSLPSDATYERIMELLDELSGIADNERETNYATMLEAVKIGINSSAD